MMNDVKGRARISGNNFFALKDKLGNYISYLFEIPCLDIFGDM